MKTTHAYRLLVLALAAAGALLQVTPALGADALFNCQPGVPFVYPAGGANIAFNPDLGGLGPLSNAQAVQAVQDAFDRWADVPESSATFLNAGSLAVDIDETNFGPIFNPVAPNGLSEIVFDEDGAIFDLLFGPGSGILGFAGPDFGNTVTCELLEGSAFLNGPAFDDELVAEDIMVHEFGHYVNLGHVELNGQLVGFSEGGDTTGPTPDNSTFGPPPGILGTEVIETMYPFYFGSPDVGTRTPHADDVAAIGTLYPAVGFPASHGTISGTVFAANGTTRLSGVNVIARNLADPFVDSVSTFTGAFTDSTAQTDPNVGTFVLNNLKPGATYALFVDQVTALAGRFSNPVIILPGPEEYWNTGESNSDPPLVFTGITAVAGSPATGRNIIFNQPQAGDPLPVGDDGNVQLALPFTFNLCGQPFDSLFVNANGNVTFGAPSTDFTESSAEMLSGPPRIAALWDDLNPTTGGTVTFAQTSNSFSVIWDDVPEWFATGSNSFTITLKKGANHIDIAYGDLSVTDGLAGVSCGGAITSGFETPVDLSSFGSDRIDLHDQPAVWELFPLGTNDLEGTTVRFTGTTNYEDNWAEPNDSPSQARHLTLPFDSIPIDRYTEIEPTGADIDWYRFEASAGDILVAEIIAGQLDSLIALFDSGGALIAVDDDGGAGLLSRIATPLPADDTYFLAVTTFPDFGLTGAGGSGGRYVLDLATSDELPLSLGDDTFVEVPLPFSFPYQGSNWSSVFVNSNGNLTFGSGDTDFSESVSELLNDQPRIAPLWDDLSPNNGGTVSVGFGAGTVTVNFVNVPEFVATGANTFSVTLHADGTVGIVYGAVSALDGIVGVTQGGGAANPGETDLSAGGPFSAVGTTYEQFTGAGDPFDLDGASLTFDP
jgi:hypothetical protein